MNRTINYLAGMLLLVFFTACEKNNITDSQSELVTARSHESQKWQDLDLEKEPVYDAKKCDFSKIYKVGNTLSFKDMKHFRATLECLERQLDDHLNRFDYKYSQIPTEELDDMADQIGFNDWKPLEDFENYMDFSSRRMYIENAIVNWLEFNNTNLSNDPDDLDDLDEELRTLINVEGGVFIGGDLYNFLDEDPASSGSIQGEGNGITDSGTYFAPDSCSFFRKRKKLEPYGSEGDKQFKLKIVLSSWPWKMKQKAKVVNYKRNSNGFWRRARTELTVQVFGAVRDFDCNFPLPYGAFKGPKRRKSLKCKRVNWAPPTWARYKKNEGTATCTMEDGAFSGVISSL